MAGIVGTQDLWIVGSRFYFESGTRMSSGKIIDLGTVDAINPQLTTNIAELKDGEKGILRLLDQSVTQIDEVYNITVKNFSLNNLSTLFLGGSWGGTATTQASNNNAQGTLKMSLEDVNNIGGNNITGAGGVYLMQLVDTSGNALRNVSGTVSLTVGGVSQTEGTNWSWYDKSRGLIRFITLATNTYSPTITVSSGRATAFGSGSSLSVVPTGASLACGYAAGRVLAPQTATLSALTGTGHVYWTRNNGEYVTARSFPCQIQPAGSAMSADDYSSWTLAVTVLANSTVSGESAGRLVSVPTNTNSNIEI